MKERPRNLLDESRTGTIARHYKCMMDELRGVSWESQSDLVIDIYDRRTPEDLRTLKWVRHGDRESRQKANAQTLRRWLGVSRNTPMPIEAVEPVLLAMPEPYQQRCKDDLAERIDAIYLPRPKPGADVGKFATLLAEVADTCSATAPILADGLINEADRPLIPKAIYETRQLIIAALAFEAQLQYVLDQHAAGA